MAQTIESFVGTALDDARMSPIHWRVFALIAAGYFFDVADYVILGVARRAATRQSRSG